MLLLLVSCGRPKDNFVGCDPYMLERADDRPIIIFDKDGNDGYKIDEIDTLYILKYNGQNVCTDSISILHDENWGPSSILPVSAFDRFHKSNPSTKFYELKIKDRPEKFILKNFIISRTKGPCFEKSTIKELIINDSIVNSLPFVIKKQ